MGGMGGEARQGATKKEPPRISPDKILARVRCASAENRQETGLQKYEIGTRLRLN